MVGMEIIKAAMSYEKNIGYSQKFSIFKFVSNSYQPNYLRQNI